MAEVLITLGVIGVVAAMTIPTLMNKIQYKTIVSQLKKDYSVFSNAYTLAVQDNGTPDTWELVAFPTISPGIVDILKPYMKVVKDCTDGSQGCWPAGVAYKYLSTGDNGVYDDANYPKIILNDGTLVWGLTLSSTCGVSIGTSQQLQNVCGFYVLDVNGNKGPNQWGKDTFELWLTKYGIIPQGSSQQTGSHKFDTACKDKSTGNGLGCAAWVIYNENMDYLKCSTLAWGGQTTCP